MLRYGPPTNTDSPHPFPPRVRASVRVRTRVRAYIHDIHTPERSATEALQVGADPPMIRVLRDILLLHGLRDDDHDLCSPYPPPVSFDPPFVRSALPHRITAGLGADVVYECAGVPPALQSAVDLARRGGAVSLIGLAASDALTKPGEWLRKEINVFASLGYTHEEFEMSMSYVADGKIDLDAIHTGTVPLDEIGKAFSDLSSGVSGELKILVDPR